MTKKADNEIGKPYVPKISEDQLQKQVAFYMDHKHPGVWCHIPNGGSRHLLEAVKLKAMGVKPGFPDIMIFVPKMQWSELNGNKVGSPETLGFGFFVELKVGKNKCSDKQLEVQKMLKDNGWMGTTCWNFEDSIKAIEDYFAGKFVS